MMDTNTALRTSSGQETREETMAWIAALIHALETSDNDKDLADCIFEANRPGGILDILNTSQDPRHCLTEVLSKKHGSWLIAGGLLMFTLAWVNTQAFTASHQRMAWVTGLLGGVHTLLVVALYNWNFSHWWARLILAVLVEGLWGVILLLQQPENMNFFSHGLNASGKWVMGASFGLALSSELFKWLVDKWAPKDSEETRRRDAARCAARILMGSEVRSKRE